jgi:hypothetical protein
MESKDGRQQNSRRSWRHAKAAAFVLLSVGFLGAALAADMKTESPVASLVKLNLKFDGAKTCAAASCHGGTEPGKSPHGLNTYTLWSGKDPHRGAYDILGNDESKKIAGAMSIADATKSENCLSCHATNVPESLQGKDFAVDEGNSCTTCHGPTQKWLEAHSTEGWTEGQRKAAGAPAFGYETKLLASQGLYDTKSLVFRAERCASCHLSIDATLVKAGHPVPYFELDYFSNPNVYADRHWKDGTEPYFNTKQWASGQIVAVRDAFRQLALRASGGADDEAVKSAYEQAMSHAHALKASGLAADVVAKAMDVKMGDKAAMATAATAVSAAAEAAFPAVAGYTPSKADTLKAASALANDADLTALGIHGVEQQAYGLLALYNAYSISEKAPDSETGPVNDAIGKLFTPLDKATRGKMDGYADALKDVAGKLPK